MTKKNKKLVFRTIAVDWGPRYVVGEYDSMEAAQAAVYKDLLAKQHKFQVREDLGYKIEVDNCPHAESEHHTKLGAPGLWHEEKCKLCGFRLSGKWEIK